MLFAAAFDPATLIGGSFGIVLAAVVTGWFTLRVATKNNRAEAKRAKEAAASAGLSRDTTEQTAETFKATINALALAVAEAKAVGLTATDKAALAVEAEQRCRADFRAHKEATEGQIAAMRQAMDALIDRIGAGEHR